MSPMKRGERVQKCRYLLYMRGVGRRTENPVDAVAPSCVLGTLATALRLGRTVETMTSSCLTSCRARLGASVPRISVAEVIDLAVLSTELRSMYLNISSGALRGFHVSARWVTLPSFTLSHALTPVPPAAAPRQPRSRRSVAPRRRGYRRSSDARPPRARLPCSD